MILPEDVLEKIFLYITDRRMLYKLTTVCQQFRAVVHVMAVRRLRKLLLSAQMKLTTTKKLGWEEIFQEHHTECQCPCIDIAFRYKPFGYDDDTGGPLHIDAIQTNHYDCFAVVDEKVFYFDMYHNLMIRKRSDKEEYGIPTNDPNNTSQKEVVDRHLYHYGKTLVILSTYEERDDSTSDFSISIIDTDSNQICGNLDFQSHLTELSDFCISDIALTKDTLAVQVLYSYSIDYTKSKSVTLLYSIDAFSPATEPVLSSELLHTTLNPVYLPSGFIYLNEYFLVLQVYNMDCLLYYDRRQRVYNEVKYFELKELVGLSMFQNIYLEPEKSSYLLYSKKLDNIKRSVYLVCLQTQQKLISIDEWPGILGNWFGGVFLLLLLDQYHEKSVTTILDPIVASTQPGKVISNYRLVGQENIEDTVTGLTLGRTCDYPHVGHGFHLFHLDADGLLLVKYGYLEENCEKEFDDIVL